ncbi:MAG TPA: hypothetical protein P5191_05865 [Ruminococcus sp.]|nr:hypothetical protein [Ruminococcus sp.]
MDDMAAAEKELSGEELLAEYDNVRKESDPPAVQAAVCIAIGAGLFLLSLKYPELAGRLLERFRELSEGESVIPDPIDMLAGLIDKLQI